MTVVTAVSDVDIDLTHTQQQHVLRNILDLWQQPFAGQPQAPAPAAAATSGPPPPSSPAPSAPPPAPAGGDGGLLPVLLQVLRQMLKADKPIFSGVLRDAAYLSLECLWLLGLDHHVIY